MSGFIALTCQKCGRTKPYDRRIDRTIPVAVTKIVSAFCDALGCDEPGSFLSEEWFDADGKIVVPE